MTDPADPAPREKTQYGARIDIEDVARHIDAARQASREAFVSKDMKTFMRCYAADFEYVQPNGQVLTRQQFERGVTMQMRELRSVDFMQHTLEERHVEGGDVVERIRTESRATAVSLLFLVRVFRVRRVQLNRWVQTRAGWRLRRTDVVEEESTVDRR